MVRRSKTKAATLNSQQQPRLYGRAWQKARAAFLLKYPLCAEHAKRKQVVQATIVDHVKPHRGDLKLFWDSSNWQSLCKPCHDRHKQRFEKSGKVVGADKDGIPIDSNHHWNK